MPNRDGTGPRGKGPLTGKRGGNPPPRDGLGKGRESNEMGRYRKRI